jgi:hypothetical protein
MRAIQLLLMMLATAMNPVFSQKQLPASIQPYAVNWGYSVKSMFQAAGYEVPGPKADFDLKPAIETRSEAPRLDSTITYHGYDLNQQDSMPLFRNIHTYPQQDVEVVTEYYYNLDQWVPLSRTTMVSDDLGRLVDAFAMIYDDATGDYLPDSRIVFYPYENSMTEADSFFVYGWAPELKDWHRLLAVWNRFDGAGRLGESLSSTELFEFPIVFLDRHFYNTEGDLARIESFNIDGGEEYPSSRESFWYVDHLLQNSILETSDGANGFIAESKIEYTYTPSRKQELVKSFVVDFSVNDWVLTQVIGYGYDAEERVSMREESNLTESGTWERKLDAYDYFKDEHLASESSLTYDNVSDVWILEDKTYYYYNETTAYEPVDPISIGALKMWPNPSTGIVNVKMTEEATVEVYSLSGQLVGQYQIDRGENVMNLTALPAGVYQVKAKSDGDYYAGKLVLQQL